MKINIVYLLLIALLGITVSASIAQQNQNVPKTDTEVEKLKIQLQTAENEKIGLETKLAEAQAKHAAAYAKLIETEFDKLKLELKDSNEKWLLRWIGFFGVIFAVFGVILFSHFKTKVDQMIESGVEKSLTGFQDGLKQVDILNSQLRMLQKHYVVSVIENYIRFTADQSYYSEILNTFPEQALIDAFCDEKFPISVKHVAAEVLANMQSTQFVSPAVKFLNSVNLDLYLRADHWIQDSMRAIVNFIGQTQMQEAYHELEKFLDRLLTNNPEYKKLFLPCTIFSLAHLGIELDIKDSIDMLREVIPDLKEIEQDEIELITLAKYFDKFKEHEGIKEILTNGLTDFGMPDVEKRCLELLPKRYSNFVKEWKDKKEDTNTESEES